jgi:phage protein D
MGLYPNYVPDFRIRINGNVIPSELRASIISIRYTDGIEGADRVEVSLANEDLQWLDNPLLQVDNTFTLSIGYAGDTLDDAFFGEITGVDASFPASGLPTLTVIAQDRLHRLTEGTKDRSFQISVPCVGKMPLPDPVLVSLAAVADLLVPYPDAVGSALSFLALLVSYAIDPLEAKRGVRIQKGQSDFDFLSQIAKENGWEMYIDHTREPRGFALRFQFPLPESTASVTLERGKTLIDFTPRISIVGQVASVSTRIWISSLGLELVIVLGWDYDRAAFNFQVYPGLGNLAEQLGEAQSVVRVDAVGIATAPKAILSELLPRLNNRQTGAGSCVGNPAIKAGRVIQLNGLGDQFGGMYRVTSAAHTFDSGGYRTQFDVRKEVWFGSVPRPTNSRLISLQGQTV